MFNVRKRLGASILLTFLSIVSIGLLLPSSRVKKLQKITLGTTIDYTELWNWGSGEVVDGEEENNGNGTRLVIFGDSWVDGWREQGQEETGNNWPQFLCDEISCTSRLNFAASQPSDAWPSSPPTGVMTSNEIHAWALSQNQKLRGVETNNTYPDLASQISSFMSLPAPKIQPSETIFILSFGFWDIYDFSRLDFLAAQNVTDTSIDFIFDQLDVLYTHFATNLCPANTKISNSTIITHHSAPVHKFQVIIPRILDPTLAPGWISQHPVPVKPSSVAEQQKNAVYLTERWNQGVETKIAAWMERAASVPAIEVDSSSTIGTIERGSDADVRENAAEGKTDSGKLEQFGSRDIKEEEKENPTSSLPRKDIFYHDTPSLLIDLIIEHQLEDEGLSDATGLGKGESPFDTVSIPCLRSIDQEDLENVDNDGWREWNGILVCSEPDMYMWWDAWSLGSKGNKMVGEAVGSLVREGKSLRYKMENKGQGSWSGL